MVGCQRFPKALQQSWYPIKISLNHHFFGPRWWRYPLCPRHSTWTSSSWQLVWCWSRTWSPAQSTSTISNSLPARRSCANSFCTRIMWAWGKLTPQGTSVWVIYWVRIRLGFGLVVLGVVLMNLTAGAWWHAASMALDQDLRTHPINSGIFYVHPKIHSPKISKCVKCGISLTWSHPSHCLNVGELLSIDFWRLPCSLSRDSAAPIPTLE